MANHASLSKKQADALQRFLKIKLGDSVDELVKELGQQDAFVLVLLHQRLEANSAEGSSEA